MEFTLEITLGNAVMQTSDDVAEALGGVADSLLAGVQSGTIRDINGNTVGSWNLPTLPPEYAQD